MAPSSTKVKASADAKARARAKAKAKARAKSRAKALPVCTAKDLKKKKSKRRRCRTVKPKAKPTTPTISAPVAKPSPSGPVAAPPAVAPTVDAFPTAPVATAPPVDGVVELDAPLTVQGAHRLLFRAGFGPKPGQAEELSALGLRGAVDRLLSAPAGDRLDGPAPTGTYLVGGALAPADKYGHLALSMLDRQVRSSDPLGERMVLVLHDWFAVATQAADQRYVLDHIALLRRGWRGSFRQLLLDVTVDPAMLQFLDCTSNRKGSPNENYARELMELYALGADRGAYTEDDVREMARALTGFRNDYSDALGSYNFRFDAARFDGGIKTVFGGTAYERSGRLGWQDAVNAVVDHPLHASFVVTKLWSYFVPTAPTDATVRDLETIYRSSGEALLPVVRAILLHPDLHQGPAMVKPPAVFAAGLLRSRGLGIATDAWVYRLDAAGQFLGNPPNVSGWNDKAWLNTSSHSARWGLAQEALKPTVASAAYKGRTESPSDALAAALAFWGNPPLSDDHAAALQRVAQETWAPRTLGDTYGSMENFLAQRQNVLRQLVAAAPDAQVS